MTRRLNNLGKIGALAALMLVGMLPAGARAAEQLIFRNETNGVIIVQAAYVYRGALHRDRPYLLKNGDTTAAIVTPAVNKIITIYDGINPNRVIYQGNIPGGLGDQFIGVSAAPAGGVAIAPEKPPAP